MEYFWNSKEMVVNTYVREKFEGDIAHGTQLWSHQMLCRDALWLVKFIFPSSSSKVCGKYFPSCIIWFAHLILSSLASSFLDIFDENMITGWLAYILFLLFSVTSFEVLNLCGQKEDIFCVPYSGHLCASLECFLISWNVLGTEPALRPLQHPPAVGWWERSQSPS